jgi:hypothetical protein
MSLSGRVNEFSGLVAIETLKHSRVNNMGTLKRSRDR